jgi:hypothetical protein
LYDKIANELEGTISMIANKLGISKSILEYLLVVYGMKNIKIKE